jgi:hypothetical protein
MRGGGADHEGGGAASIERVPKLEFPCGTNPQVPTRTLTTNPNPNPNQVLWPDHARDASRQVPLPAPGELLPPTLPHNGRRGLCTDTLHVHWSVHGHTACALHGHCTA